MNEERLPTLKSVAERAGVTAATVSMALRNHPALRPETRERVQRIAREMGYRPNPMVATLMTQVRRRKRIEQRTTLAWITSWPTRNGWRESSPLFADYFAGASDRAHELGYQLEEIWAKEKGMTGRRLTGILQARNIRG